MAKIPDGSLYRKIESVLEIQKRLKAESLEGLVDDIKKGKLKSFAYRRRDKAGTLRRNVCRPETIAGVVRICQGLDLLDSSSFLLTNIGLRATDHRRFPNILVKQVEIFLELQGASVDQIVEVIQNCFSGSNQPIMPGPEEIHQRLSPGVNLTLFKRYLNLLGLCGALRTFQRKIYLPL